MTCLNKKGRPQDDNIDWLFAYKHPAHLCHPEAAPHSLNDLKIRPKDLVLAVPPRPSGQALPPQQLHRRIMPRDPAHTTAAHRPGSADQYPLVIRLHTPPVLDLVLHERKTQVLVKYIPLR